MNHNDFVSVDNILFDVLTAVGDTTFDSGLSKGWYTSQVRKALKELAFDTFFAKVTLDLNMDKDRLAIEIPRGVFNIREMYVFNGSCSDPANFRVVHWKRLENNRGKGGNASSRIRKGGENYSDDPYLFSINDGNNYSTGGKVARYYAGIQNGLIMFSSACAGYSKVRVVFNGINGDISNVPIIPMFLETAVQDFVKKKYYEVKKGENPRKYRVLWHDAKDEYENPTNGSKRNARLRVSAMDTWEKESLEEYLSSMYHK